MYTIYMHLYLFKYTICINNVIYIYIHIYNISIKSILDSSLPALPGLSINALQSETWKIFRCLTRQVQVRWYILNNTAAFFALRHRNVLFISQQFTWMYTRVVLATARCLMSFCLAFTSPLNNLPFCEIVFSLNSFSSREQNAHRSTGDFFLLQIARLFIISDVLY